MKIIKKPGWLGLLLYLLSGCTQAVDPWKEVSGGSTKVLVTIPPLYCFAKNVAGDDAAVLCLLGNHGPHDYEPTPLDALKARNASLFLSVGLGLDEFVGKIVNSSGNKKVEVIELGEDKVLPEEMLLASAAGHEDDGHHHHGDHDPHVWLGIPQSIKMVEHIGAALERIDPKHKEGYAARTRAYAKELEKLKKEGQEAFKGKKNRKLIATHDSLRYFAASFGLEIIDSIQPSPGSEADAAKMARLVKVCKEKDIRVIAVEPQYPSTSAETLKKQLKAQGIPVELVIVDPMETADEPDAGYYVKKMRDNINNLAGKLP